MAESVIKKDSLRVPKYGADVTNNTIDTYTEQGEYFVFFMPNMPIYGWVVLYVNKIITSSATQKTIIKQTAIGNEGIITRNNDGNGWSSWYKVAFSVVS